jgi:hypothetical protein
MKIFSSEENCKVIWSNSISAGLISISGCLSVLCQFMDPYQRRIIKSFFIQKNNSDKFKNIKTLGDLKEMLGDFKTIQPRKRSRQMEHQSNNNLNENIDQQNLEMQNIKENINHDNKNYVEQRSTNLLKPYKNSDFHILHNNNQNIVVERKPTFEKFDKTETNTEKDCILYNQHLHNSVITPNFANDTRKQSDNNSNTSEISSIGIIKSSDMSENNLQANQNTNNNIVLSNSIINIKNAPQITQIMSFKMPSLDIENLNSFKRKSKLFNGLENKFSLVSFRNSSISNLEDRTFDLLNFHMELTDNICRMIGIAISVNQDRKYDKDLFYKQKFVGLLPWPDKNLYTESTEIEEYRQETLPDWVSIKYEKKFKFLKFKIKKYSPLVFHHIRIIDGVTIDDCIKSLDPILNLDKIAELKVSGGRSPNSILYTWDKKMLIKTISKQEKELYVHELLPKYHIRMRDTKTLLCRIYGLFSISISDQFTTYVVLMKNMTTLPESTKILSFDLKGSTVDRNIIPNEEIENLSKEELYEDYKNITLKDNDLKALDFKLNLTSHDALNFINAVEKDSYFLEKYWITDYSLLLAIHEFRRDDYLQNYENLRVIKTSDNKYLLSFSIIDFLTVILYKLDL